MVPKKLYLNLFTTDVFIKELLIYNIFWFSPNFANWSTHNLEYLAPERIAGDKYTSQVTLSIFPKFLSFSKTHRKNCYEFFIYTSIKIQSN